MTGIRNLGKRIICLVLCGLCLLSLAQPVAAGAGEEAVITLTTLVHSSASYGSGVIGQLENGTAVTVLATYQSFYKIDCYDMNGYVAKEQIVHSDNGEYYVNCQTGSSETKTLCYTDYAAALDLRSALLDEAATHLGTHYVYGGTRPGGFDCSGFTSYVYKTNGISLHRTASQQLQDGIIVAKEGLQAGDLVFFREGPTTSLATHVSIYVGDGKIIHSGSRGICYADLSVDYFADYYLCARRIVNTGGVKIDGVSAMRSSTALTVNSLSGRTAN